VVLVLFASSGQGATQEELLRKIEQLSKELEALKAQLKEIKEKQATQEEKVSADDKTVSAIKEGVGKFKIGGDIRVRIDSTRADVKQNAFMLEKLKELEGMLQTGRFLPSDYHLKLDESLLKEFKKKTYPHKEENDSLWTNRLRLDLSVKPT
jgi:vacuolar-type H+-ATPase subunit I/STV1